MLRFHADDVPQSRPADALFHVIPVPYEKTVSYGAGTGDGPRALLEASAQLEIFDGRSRPSDYGIHTTDAVDCSGTHEENLDRIRRAVSQTLELSRIPVLLGGEHTLTTGAIDACIDRFGSDFGVVQFDAHADLRESYEGSIYSHASVMKRIVDRGLPIYQIANRSYCEDEAALRCEKRIPHCDADVIAREGLAAVELPPDFPSKIYITFDLDGLDPSVIPATGTPVPGGLFWHDAMRLLERIIETRVCIGYDVVELAPIRELHYPDFAAAQLTYNIMGFITRSRVNRDAFKLK